MKNRKYFKGWMLFGFIVFCKHLYLKDLVRSLVKSAH